MLQNKQAQEVFECVTNTEHNPDLNESWCSLTGNYDEDKQWKYCNGIDIMLKNFNLILKIEIEFFLEKLISTTGGNSNGGACHFPFIFHSNFNS